MISKFLYPNASKTAARKKAGAGAGFGVGRRVSYPQIFPVLIARFAVLAGAAGGLLDFSAKSCIQISHARDGGAPLGNRKVGIRKVAGAVGPPDGPTYPQIFPELIARFAVFTGAAGGLPVW